MHTLHRRGSLRGVGKVLLPLPLPREGGAQCEQAEAAGPTPLLPASPISTMSFILCADVVGKNAEWSIAKPEAVNANGKGTKEQ